MPVRLDISRTTGDGYALRLRFEASLRRAVHALPRAGDPGVRGRRARGLQPHEPRAHRGEPAQRGGSRHEDESEDLISPYVEDGVLDLAGWARDALALTLPANLLCREDCAGLCPVCGADLNAAGPDHRHEREPDPRWAELSELRFE